MTDFDNMPFFWTLMILEQHKEWVEKQNSENDQQGDMIASAQAQMENMSRYQQQNMPKFETPKMPDFNSQSFMQNMHNFSN